MLDEGYKEEKSIKRKSKYARIFRPKKDRPELSKIEKEYENLLQQTAKQKGKYPEFGSPEHRKVRAAESRYSRYRAAARRLKRGGWAFAEEKEAMRLSEGMIEAVLDGFDPEEVLDETLRSRIAHMKQIWGQHKKGRRAIETKGRLRDVEGISKKFSHRVGPISQISKSMRKAVDRVMASELEPIEQKVKVRRKGLRRKTAKRMLKALFKRGKTATRKELEYMRGGKEYRGPKWRERAKRRVQGMKNEETRQSNPEALKRLIKLRRGEISKQMKDPEWREAFIKARSGK